MTPSSPASPSSSASRCHTPSPAAQRKARASAPCSPHPLAQHFAHRPWHLSALHFQPQDQLHLRRHPHPDRPRLHFRLPARTSPPALAVDRAGRHPLRLLACLGALSRARPKLQLAAVGVPPDWHTIYFTGFASHWNKNSNLGQAFDLWFLNLFPRPSRFLLQRRRLSHPQLHSHARHHAARPRRRPLVPRAAPRIPMRRFLLAAACLCAAGLLLHFTGICPIVKRIWTPVLDAVQRRHLLPVSRRVLLDRRREETSPLAFPLVVVGMNSIAAYVIAHLCETSSRTASAFISACACSTVFGAGRRARSPRRAYPCAYWVFLYWMFQRKIFLRI